MVDSYKQPERLLELKTLLESKSLPATLLVQATLNDVVDLFDKSIKSMKSSTKYTEADKIANFREMVKSYRELLESLVRNIITEEDLKTDSINYYLILLKEQEEKAPTTSDTLHSSQGFEVPPALITSRALFLRHLSHTTEDVFTLTHQNLLAVTSALGGRFLSKDLLNRLPTPQLFKGAFEIASSLAASPKAGGAQILGVNVDDKKIVICFNLPLYNHSATFELIYEASTNNIYLQFHFLGEGRERWRTIQERLAMLHLGNDIILKGPPELSPNALHITYTLRNFATMKNALQISKSAADFSIDLKFTDNLPSNVAIASNAMEMAINGRQNLQELAMPECTLYPLIEAICTDEYRTNQSIQQFEKVAKLGGELITTFINSEQPKSTKLSALRSLRHWLDKAVTPYPSFSIHSPLITDSDPEIRALAVYIVGKYVEYGVVQVHDEDKTMLNSLALQGLEASDANVQKQSAALLQILANKGFSPNACKDVIKNLFHPSAGIRENAFQLITSIISLDFEAVKDGANSCLNSPSVDIQILGLKLYAKLANNGPFYKDAHLAAVQSLQSESQHVREEALNIYHQLVNNERFLEEISTQEIENLINYFVDNKIAVLETLDKLARIGKILPDFKDFYWRLADFTQAGIEDQDPEVRKRVRILITTLYTSNINTHVLERAASTLIATPSAAVRKEIWQLLIDMKDNQNAGRIINNLIIACLYNESDDIQVFGYKFYTDFASSIFRDNPDFLLNKAQPLAARGLESASVDVQWEALNLYRALFDSRISRLISQSEVEAILRHVNVNSDAARHIVNRLFSLNRVLLKNSFHAFFSNNENVDNIVALFWGDSTLRYWILGLLQEFVKTGQHFDQIKYIAEKSIKYPDPQIASLASEIVKEIDEKTTWLTWLVKWVKNK